MLKNTINRTWLSPMTAITFAAVAVTGVLMLLHVRSPILHGIHEWIGLIFAIAGLFHLILNWRAFIGYFRSKAAIGSLAVGVLLCAALGLASSGGKPGGPHGPPAAGQSTPAERHAPAH